MNAEDVVYYCGNAGTRVERLSDAEKDAEMGVEEE